MERISRFRAIVLLVIFCVVLSLYSIRLFNLQIVETKGNTDNTTTYTTLTRVKAARGDILDRNGNVLVGNRASYDLVFNHYVIKSADGRNEYLYKLIKTCQELGVEYADHFPVTATRPFEYTLDEYTTAWRNYFQKYLYERSLDSDITAPLLIENLRDRYEIPETWTDEEARAVIGLRYEFDLRGVAYLSNYVFIEDVSDEHLPIILELNVPGLMVESSTVREYYTSYAAHILGYVGSMDDDQWTYYNELGYAMDAEVGQTGFEEAFESDLHATDGTRVDVVAKDGTIISQYYKEGEEPKAGNNVESSIDINIQMITEDALAEIIEYLKNPDSDPADSLGEDVEGAAAVVMEVKTGQILAMASYPTYDLATLRENYDEILKQDFDPLYNRALMGIYYPGSAFKMCTLVAALNNGFSYVGEEIMDEGIYMEYASSGFTPRCLKYTSSGGAATHNLLTAPHALEVSCNYFFYVLGDRMKSVEYLDNTSKAFGLGEPTGVELDEKVGHRANAESKALYYSAAQAGFYIGDLIQASIGQSENRFTPLQLCVYACTLANEGIRYKATFLNRVVSDDYSSLIRQNEPEILSILEIADDVVATYKEGMSLVVSGSQGTARNTMAGLPVPVAAKTGTAQTGMAGSDHGSFICFAPVDDPEIAICVYGEKAAHGSTLGRVAKAVLEYYFDTVEEGAVVASENALG